MVDDPVQVLDPALVNVFLCLIGALVAACALGIMFLADAEAARKKREGGR